MDNKEFNEQRHNRKKQQYRFILGIQQLWNYPLLNLIGRLFAGGVVFLVMAKSKYIASVEVYSMFETIFTVCTTAIIIIFPIICAIGIVQLVGFLFAIRDEADMEIVFGDKRDVKNQPYQAFNARLLAEDAPADDEIVLTSGKSYSNVFHKNGAGKEGGYL